jgi:uncharacterized protein YggE
MPRLSHSLLLLAAAPLFGQLPSNTLTISASRSVVFQPDQVVFGLTVSSSPNTNLDQIVAALAGIGVAYANLSGIDNNNAPLLDWNFTLAAPISNLTATINSLTNLQRTITQNNSGLMLTFIVEGTQVSLQLQQSQSCSNADLISDATAQAQKLATAAGMRLGPILELSNAQAPETSISGVFGVAQLALAAHVVPISYSPPLTCSLSVQFQLLP